ncbi:MAG: hypothetical protein K6G03_00020 [Lachnospiraceae bacterium]|nr:hypothetical protein [Lachnospiraceae bacterium]
MGWVWIILLVILFVCFGGKSNGTENHADNRWDSYEDEIRRCEEEEEQRRRLMEEEEEQRRRREEEEARDRAMYDEDDGVFGWDSDHGFWL